MVTLMLVCAGSECLRALMSLVKHCTCQPPDLASQLVWLWWFAPSFALVIHIDLST